MDELSTAPLTIVECNRSTLSPSPTPMEQMESCSEELVLHSQVDLPQALEQESEEVETNKPKMPKKKMLPINEEKNNCCENEDRAGGGGPENRYTRQERVRIVQLYSENRNNPKRVQRFFQAEYKKKPPAAKTITKLFRKFEQTGSVLNNYQKVRPRTSRTDENVEKVKLAFKKTPTKSIRKIAEELNIPHTTVGRILQELKGKEGGQIRRSRTLKIGMRSPAVVSEKNHASAIAHNSSDPSSSNNVVTETRTKTGVVPEEFSQQAEEYTRTTEAPAAPSQTGAPLVTLQAAPPPLVSTTTLRAAPPIFIVDTSPRDILSNLFYCLDFACKKHSAQRRKDPQQTPYINHPIGVANILINEGQIYDAEILQAAVLHDTVEDTDTTIEELKTNFGPKVASIVHEVTDDKSLSKEMRKLMQIQNGGKKSYGAQLVAMADKIYNLRDLTRVSPAGWTEQRRFEYVLWAQEVVRSYYPTNEALAKILRDIFLQWSVLS